MMLNFGYRLLFLVPLSFILVGCEGIECITDENQYAEKIIYQGLSKDDASLYTYSKFYFFTCIFLPFYVIGFYNEMGLAMVIQLVLPIFMVITIVYSIIKILAIKKYKIAVEIEYV